MVLLRPNEPPLYAVIAKPQEIDSYLLRIAEAGTYRIALEALDPTSLVLTLRAPDGSTIEEQAGTHPVIEQPLQSADHMVFVACRLPTAMARYTLGATGP